MKIKIYLLSISTFFFLGCTSYKVISTKKLEVKGLKLNGEKRMSYTIYDAETNRTYILNEPPPDLAVERATTVANDLSAKKGEDSVTISQKIELANKIVQLGERTVAVNILRDALYRLSEMNVNNRNIKLEESYRALFDSILSVSKQIAIKDIIKAKTKETEAETEKVKQEIIKNNQEMELWKAQNITQ